MSTDSQHRPPGMLVVTTETITGFEITYVAGHVIGIAARSKSPYAEGFTSIRDGRTVDYVVRRDLLIAARYEAVEQMSAEAARLGGNAVVMMRFDHRLFTPTWTEVCAYGTAVHVVPTRAPKPALALSGGATHPPEPR